MRRAPACARRARPRAAGRPRRTGGSRACRSSSLGSTRTPTIARTFERHCQQRSSTVRTAAGDRRARGGRRPPRAGSGRAPGRRPNRRRGSELSSGGTMRESYWQVRARTRARWGICAFSAPKTAKWCRAFDERSVSAAQRRMPARPSRTSTNAAKSASPRPRPIPAREHLAGVRGGGERDPRGLPLLEAQAHVLEHVLELEQRRVVVRRASARPSGRASRCRRSRRP